MKTFACLMMAGLLMLAPPIMAGDVHHATYKSDSNHRGDHGVRVKSFSCWEVDNARYKLDDGSIIMTNLDDRDESVVITEDYELFVNDRQVRLDREQQALVREYHELTYEIVGEAKVMAKEGVKIGLKGAKLGLKAIGGVLKMLMTSYDEDEFEADMEREGEKLEAMGEVLEAKGELIEKKADRLEEVHDELIEDIPELRELDWLRY